MSFLEYSRKLDRLQFLIEYGIADTAETIADDLGVSSRSVYRMIETLRYKNVEIYYCNRTKKYFVKKGGD